MRPAEGTKLRIKVPLHLKIEPGETTEVTIPAEAPPAERTDGNGSLTDPDETDEPGIGAEGVAYA